jgi:hypothetical protein
MPDRGRVEDLVRYTVDNRLIEALEEFYHEDSTMQENSMPPRIGRQASIERQKVAQAMTAKIHEVRAVLVLIDGDRSVIEWHAEWTLVSGQRIRIEELALQEWKGDRIIRERFFYDPSPLLAAGLAPQGESVASSRSLV